MSGPSSAEHKPSSWRLQQPSTGTSYGIQYLPIRKVNETSRIRNRLTAAKSAGRPERELLRLAFLQLPILH